MSLLILTDQCFQGDLHGKDQSHLTLLVSLVMIYQSNIMVCKSRGEKGKLHACPQPCEPVMPWWPCFCIAWHFLPCWNTQYPDPLSWLPGVMLKLCYPSQLSGSPWLLAGTGTALLALPGCHGAACSTSSGWDGVNLHSIKAFSLSRSAPQWVGCGQMRQWESICADLTMVCLIQRIMD